jgi:sulfate transport system permease protein
MTDPQPFRSSHAQDPVWVRWTLTLAALLVMTILVVIPVIAVFWQAFSQGVGVYFESLFDPDTRHAVFLTLTIASCAVVLNVIFGVAAAWAIARFRFPGRTLLITLIDIPFSVSPVVAGLMFVILFGAAGWFGPWLKAHDIKILFSPPGMILATTFVTLPFVVRELIPVMEAIGADEELAGLSLGANGRQIFWQITLPNIKWGLLYGIILCNARAMGEFGAVYVVSGRIAGSTNTIPLHIEQMFAGLNTPGAFAVASVLTLLALVTLLLKVIVEQRARKAIRDAQSGIGKTP